MEEDERLRAVGERDQLVHEEGKKDGERARTFFTPEQTRLIVLNQRQDCFVSPSPRRSLAMVERKGLVRASAGSA